MWGSSGLISLVTAAKVRCARFLGKSSLKSSMKAAWRCSCKTKRRTANSAISTSSFRAKRQRVGAPAPTVAIVARDGERPGVAARPPLSSASGRQTQVSGSRVKPVVEAAVVAAVQRSAALAVAPQRVGVRIPRVAQRDQVPIGRDRGRSRARAARVPAGLLLGRLIPPAITGVAKRCPALAALKQGLGLRLERHQAAVSVPVRAPHKARTAAARSRARVPTRAAAIVVALRRIVARSWK